MEDNQTLLKDIANTEKECTAYQFLSDGFYILSQLPEYDNWEQTKYLSESAKYKSLKDECQEFLNELLDLKKIRNL